MLQELEKLTSQQNHMRQLGFDFYIPTNLHITDFTKNAEIYENNFINPETEKDYVFSNSKFILTDDSIYIEVQFALAADKQSFVYKLGKSSDGYPFLKGTLHESEEALVCQLRDDPLCIRSFKATKGLMLGNVSFDDRCYLRFRP